MPKLKFDLVDRVKIISRNEDIDTYEVIGISITPEEVKYKLFNLTNYGYGPHGDYTENQLEFVTNLAHFENDAIREIALEIEKRTHEYHQKDCGGTLAGYIFPYLRYRLLGRN